MIYRWSRNKADETRYRMDDTINIIRKSNLSVDFDKSLPYNLDDADFEQEMNEQYGAKLLELLDVLFDIKVHQNHYICSGNSRPITDKQTKVIIIC